MGAFNDTHVHTFPLDALRALPTWTAEPPVPIDPARGPQSELIAAALTDAAQP
jgi:hypothetical protein